MKRIIILITGALLLTFRVAAQQVNDVVEIDGEPHVVRADLLFPYLNKRCPEKMLRAFVEDFNEPYWPNYNRYWEIRKDRLFLLKIETKDKKVEYPLERLFVNYDGSPVFAGWFSGTMSYQSGDSPEIQLNRTYFEKEEVIRVRGGVVIERFRVNHRDRWLADARQIMDRYRPLAIVPPDQSPAEAASEKGLVAFLEDAYRVVTQPEDGHSFYLPVIVVEFNADIGDFELTEAHRKLTSYELLETIADETGTILDVAISKRKVIYEIRERDLTGDKPRTSLSGAARPGGMDTPAE